MRHRSDVWTKIASKGEFTMEAVAYIDGKKYTTITAPEIDRTVISEPLSVGNCATASLKLSVLTDDVFSAGAEVVIQARIYNNTDSSEWMNFGTFYIDTRDTSYDGLVTLTCYDAMKKADQLMVDEDNYNTVDWPKPMTEVVEMIAETLGVKLDPRTAIKTADYYKCDLPNGLTIRQVLEGIAAVHGGNWIITEENALRLVPPMVIPSADSWNIIDESYNKITSDDGTRIAYRVGVSEESASDPVSSTATQITVPDALKDSYYINGVYSEDSNTYRITTKDGFTLIYGDDSTIYAVTGIINIPVVCGELSTGQKLTISRITMTDSNGSSYSVGDDTGFELKFTTQLYTIYGLTDSTEDDSTETAANEDVVNVMNDLLTELSGFVYAPYTATTATYDPAAETGDQVRIGDEVLSVIYNQVITLDTGYHSDLTAPASQETESEYPYLGEVAQLKDTATSTKVYTYEISSRIDRISNAITLEVNAELPDSATEEEKSIRAALELKVNTSDYNGSKIVSMLNGVADIITLEGGSKIELSTAGQLIISAGNFTLDEYGNVVCNNGTFNNGTFNGSVVTNADSDKCGVKIDGGEIRLTYDSTEYLRIMSSYWGINSGTGRGAQLRADNYLYIADTDGYQVLAVNTGGNPNGFTQGLLVFDSTLFENDITVGGSHTIKLAGSDTVELGQTSVTFSGNFVYLTNSIFVPELYFQAAPCSGTLATGLTAILSHLEGRIAALEG